MTNRLDNVTESIYSMTNRTGFATDSLESMTNPIQNALNYR